MASEDMGLVPTQRLENGLNSQLGFQDESSRFNCGGVAPQSRVGDPGPKTRELSGFIDDRYFQAQVSEFRRSIYPSDGTTHAPSGGEGSDGDEDDEDDDDDDDDEEGDDDDEVDEGDGEVDGLVVLDDAAKNNNNSNSSVHSRAAGNISNGTAKHHPSFGSNRELMAKDGSTVQSTNSSRAIGEHQRQGRVGHYQNAVTIAEAEGDIYYSQFLQGPDGAASAHKEIAVQDGCGFSGRGESGESLRAILSDPITGALMDDAMILPCGHSFGSGGIQHVYRLKACCTCSQSILEDSAAPNLSLRAAVQAFRREDELQFCRSKRRREKFEQDKCSYGEPYLTDTPRGRGVQFPFAVTDRVIIKGNKRTPQRFVGREAVVTTQCLNGWYVVKTLDNAESVKLQYRSLAKVSDDPTSKPVSDKMTPNWL